jgi:hypothetical protein
MVLVVLKVLEVRSWGSESRVASKLGHHVLMAFRKRGGGQTQPIPEDAEPKAPQHRLHILPLSRALGRSLEIISRR